MYGMYGGLYGFSKPKKAKKPKKVPKDSWFERLTNDELKSYMQIREAAIERHQARARGPPPGE